MTVGEVTGEAEPDTEVDAGPVDEGAPLPFALSVNSEEAVPVEALVRETESVPKGVEVPHRVGGTEGLPGAALTVAPLALAPLLPLAPPPVLVCVTLGHPEAVRNAVGLPLPTLLADPAALLQPVPVPPNTLMLALAQRLASMPDTVPALEPETEGTTLLCEGGAVKVPHALAQLLPEAEAQALLLPGELALGRCNVPLLVPLAPPPLTLNEKLPVLPCEGVAELLPSVLALGPPPDPDDCPDAVLPALGVACEVLLPPGLLLLCGVLLSLLTAVPERLGAREVDGRAGVAEAGAVGSSAVGVPPLPQARAVPVAPTEPQPVAVADGEPEAVPPPFVCVAPLGEKLAAMPEAVASCCVPLPRAEVETQGELLGTLETPEEKVGAFDVLICPEALREAGAVLSALPLLPKPEMLPGREGEAPCVPLAVTLPPMLPEAEPQVLKPTLNEPALTLAQPENAPLPVRDAEAQPDAVRDALCAAVAVPQSVPVPLPMPVRDTAALDDALNGGDGLCKKLAGAAPVAVPRLLVVTLAQALLEGERADEPPVAKLLPLPAGETGGVPLELCGAVPLG